MYVAGLSPRLTPHFRLEIGNAGRRFSLYQGPGEWIKTVREVTVLTRAKKIKARRIQGTVSA